MFRKNKTEHICEWQAIAYVKTDMESTLHRAIQRVRELHKPFIYEKNGEIITTDICDGCTKCWLCNEWGSSDDCGCNTYPCKTIKALEGFKN